MEIDVLIASLVLISLVWIFIVQIFTVIKLFLEYKARKKFDVINTNDNRKNDIKIKNKE